MWFAVGGFIEEALRKWWIIIGMSRFLCLLRFTFRRKVDTGEALIFQRFVDQFGSRF